MSYTLATFVLLWAVALTAATALLACCVIIVVGAWRFVRGEE